MFLNVVGFQSKFIAMALFNQVHLFRLIPSSSRGKVMKDLQIKMQQAREVHIVTVERDETLPVAHSNKPPIIWTYLSGNATN